MYEEPRLREQDFGNFQPSSAEMTRMWHERADYGHFFYRIPNGESAADTYDRVASFNESLWRNFGDDRFASVCVLVTHGLMARVFLMKWYHWSVEYFEDLRNVNHCEFVVMARSPDTGKFVLRNQLRSWSQYRRELTEERERRESQSGGAAGAVVTTATATATLANPLPNNTSPVPVRKTWSGRRDSGGGKRNAAGSNAAARIVPPRRQNTEDLFRSSDEEPSKTPKSGALPLLPASSPAKERKPASALAQAIAELPAEGRAVAVVQLSPPGSDAEPAGGFKARKPERRPSLRNAHLLSQRTVLMLTAGRDGGGSRSGQASSSGSEAESDGPHFGPHYPAFPPEASGGGERDAGGEGDDEAEAHEGGGRTGAGGVKKGRGQAPRSMALALTGALDGEGGFKVGTMADVLGDQSQEDTDIDQEVRRKKKEERSFAESVR